MKSFILPLLISVTLFSCNNNETAEDKELDADVKALAAAADSMQTKSGSQTTANLNPQASMSQAQNMQAGTQQSQQVPASVQQMPAQQVQAQPTQAQPTQAQQIQTQQAAIQQQIKMQQAANAQQKTAAAPVGKGMNPAHGQPGHRCDISVGMPLSTPVAKPQTQSQTTNTSTATTTAAPQQIPAINPTTLPNGTTAKLNPAHGQPGHDCKVAVGQPLAQ